MAKITEQQLQEWRKKYTDIYEIKVEDKVGYFHAPDRNTMGYAMQQAQKNPMSANEVLAKNCFLGGDKELLENDTYFLALSARLSELIEIKSSSLKKL